MPRRREVLWMPATQRWIIHVDLDAFFASVEELLNPTWRGKPLVVGGEPGTRAVVASASYAARTYGIRSAMPVGQAVQLCPDLIIAPSHYREYARRSRAIMDILCKITPLVEQISIDEAFLDVTGCERLWGSVSEIGKMIQERVLAKQHLPVSLGIASNKLVAKIACDYGKPRGLVLVPPGEERAFLAPLPIEKLWGVGKVTGDKLRHLGIETIGDLAAWDAQQLSKCRRHLRSRRRRSRTQQQAGNRALRPRRCSAGRGNPLEKRRQITRPAAVMRLSVCCDGRYNPRTTATRPRGGASDVAFPGPPGASGPGNLRREENRRDAGGGRVDAAAAGR